MCEWYSTTLVKCIKLDDSQITQNSDHFQQSPKPSLTIDVNPTSHNATAQLQNYVPVKTVMEQQVVAQTHGVLSNANSIMNLSDYTLSTSETQLLSRGLQFIPTPTNITANGILYAAEKFGRRLKLAYFFNNRPKSVKLPFTAPSGWVPPAHMVHPEVFENIYDTREEIGSVTVPLEQKNLSNTERCAINTLKSNQDIVIKPADKGSATVIMDKGAYLAEGYRQLNNIHHYVKLDAPIYPQTARTISNIVQKLESSKFLTDKQSDYLSPSEDSRPRRFYLLPKIHKPEAKWSVANKMPPGRPIVSDCGSESYEIAEYIDSFLQPLASLHPAYVKDTPDLINKIKDIQINENSILASIDVDSMYTNIDNLAGLEAVKAAFNEHPDRNRPDAELLKLLELGLTKNDFDFNGETFLQTSGTAMGKKYAPAYANIFMAKWEKEALAKCTLHPHFYRRYQDDIIVIWNHGMDEFWHFFNTLNTHHPTIKLTATVDLKSIDFLDLTIFKGPSLQSKGTLDTKVYFKPTDTHQLLHKASFHPKHTFSSIIKSQVIRFFRNCTLRNDFEDACSILFRALRMRNYGKRMLRSIKSTTIAQLTGSFIKQLGSAKKCIGRVCYTCDSLKCSTTFRSNVKGNHYQIQSNLNCGSSNIIYLVECDLCGMQYVGETQRTLRNRINQHRSAIRTGKRSIIALHFQTPGHSFENFKVTPIEQLHNDDDLMTATKLRRLREQYWISKLDTAFPNGLNHDSTVSGLMPFVVPFSAFAARASSIVKRNYSDLQDRLPYVFNKYRVLTAYSRHKNLKDILVHSKVSS